MKVSLSVLILLCFVLYKLKFDIEDFFLNSIGESNVIN